jgi:hypothetical protein
MGDHARPRSHNFREGTVRRGARVKLLHCNDQHTKLEPGLLGTISFVDDLGTVHVRWDNGSLLGLCVDDGDQFKIIS